MENRQSDGWMDGWMEGWTDGQTHGLMDGWMDGHNLSSARVPKALNLFSL